MIDPIWCVMPVLAGPEMTEAALSDLLAQSLPTKVLVINQGVEDRFRDHLEALAEQDHRIFLWHHQPPLPSLSASWNLALDLIWASGGTEALVVNNDARFAACTIEVLRSVLSQTGAYFVSAVGVREAQYSPTPALPDPSQRGGPDFSCFLTSRTGHEKYRFDEGFIPAYGEDCDLHRRYMLGGDAARIFSVNLPFLHYASGTLKGLDPAQRADLERRIGGSRVYYAKKWGPGGINSETFMIPFDAASAREGVTNPELQRVAQQGGVVDGAGHTATSDSSALGSLDPHHGDDTQSSLCDGRLPHSAVGEVSEVPSERPLAPAVLPHASDSADR